MEFVGGFPNPFFLNLGSTNLAPGDDPRHILGTDGVGRDIFSYLIFGLAFSVVIATVISLLIVGFTTVLQRVRRGWMENVGAMLPRVLVLPFAWLSYSALIEVMIGITQLGYGLAIFQFLISLVLYLAIYAFPLTKIDGNDRIRYVSYFLAVFPSVLLDMIIMDFLGFGMQLSIGSELSSVFYANLGHPSFGIILPVLFIVIVLSYVASLTVKERIDIEEKPDLYPVGDLPEDLG